MKGLTRLSWPGSTSLSLSGESATDIKMICANLMVDPTRNRREYTKC
jgi:hypothetical protein